MSRDDLISEREDPMPRVASALTGSLLAAVGSLAMADGLLQPHQWQSRILLIFGSEDDGEALATMRSMLDEHEAGIADRDLVVGILAAGGGRFGGRELSREECLQLRSRFGAATEVFTAILIGKDGGEKLRLHRPPTALELFELIDSMPMRQSEVRRRQRTHGMGADER